MIKVTKSSGAVVPFSLKKLRKSLHRAGATEQIIRDILAVIEQEIYPGVPTEFIYNRSFELLREASSHLAARYKLKKAIMELGPSGYPFENYIGELLKLQKYDVQVGIVIPGKCVNHEIDVYAEKQHDRVLVECKYHNEPNFLCDVKISLYVHARFQDVAAGMRERGENDFFQGWLVTNTRFTEDGARFGNCAGMRLIGWDYPIKGSLKQIVDNSRLYPITCLTTLTLKEKTALLERKILLCRDLMFREDALDKIGVTQARITVILDECRKLTDKNYRIES